MDTTTLVHITGNFAGNNQCGTCSNFGLAGSISGVCEVDGKYTEHMCGDKCSCNKYNEGKPNEF